MKTIPQNLAEIRQRAEQARIWQYQELAEDSKRLVRALEHSMKTAEQTAQRFLSNPSKWPEWTHQREKELLAILDGSE